MYLVQLKQPIKVLINDEFKQGKYIIAKDVAANTVNTVIDIYDITDSIIEKSLDEYITDQITQIRIYHHNILSSQYIEL